jgi:hypothetical protein
MRWSCRFAAFLRHWSVNSCDRSIFTERLPEVVARLRPIVQLKERIQTAAGETMNGILQWHAETL